jgi:hypothetical protein
VKRKVKKTEVPPLVTDKKYAGNYVVLASFLDNTVVAYGKDLGRVLEEARAKGYDEPVFAYIPESGVVCIY